MCICSGIFTGHLLEESWLLCGLYVECQCVRQCVNPSQLLGWISGERWRVKWSLFFTLTLWLSCSQLWFIVCKWGMAAAAKTSHFSNHEYFIQTIKDTLGAFCPCLDSRLLISVCLEKHGWKLVNGSEAKELCRRALCLCVCVCGFDFECLKVSRYHYVDWHSVSNMKKWFCERLWPGCEQGA